VSVFGLYSTLVLAIKHCVIYAYAPCANLPRLLQWAEFLNALKSY